MVRDTTLSAVQLLLVYVEITLNDCALLKSMIAKKMKRCIVVRSCVESNYANLYKINLNLGCQLYQLQ
jgi:hypothetical protein